MPLLAGAGGAMKAHAFADLEEIDHRLDGIACPCLPAFVVLPSGALLVVHRAIAATKEPAVAPRPSAPFTLPANGDDET